MGPEILLFSPVLSSVSVTCSETTLWVLGPRPLLGLGSTVLKEMMGRVGPSGQFGCCWGKDSLGLVPAGLMDLTSFKCLRPASWKKLFLARRPNGAYSPHMLRYILGVRNSMCKGQVS